MASDLELSDMWRELQRNGHVKNGGPLTQHCEKEVVELMRHIDIIMRTKRIQWSSEKDVLNMRIESKERECALQVDGLEKRDKEIGQLREQIKNMESNSRTMISEYQHQVEQLRADLTSLKKHYDRLKAKYNKERVKYSNEKRENESEIWSKDRKLLQQEVERLSIQMSALTEKCVYLESRNAVTGNQETTSEPTASNPASADLTALREEIYKLKSQLHESEDGGAEKAVEIARLKSDLSHWKLKATKYSQDIQGLEAQQRKSNTEIQNLRRKSDNLSLDLKAHDDALELVAKEQTNYNQEINRLKQIVTERDNTIKVMLEKNHLEESAALESLKQDLIQLDLQNRELVESEVTLKNQLSEMEKTVEALNEKLDQGSSRNEQLERLLDQMEDEIKTREDHVIQARQNEIHELQKRVHDLRDQYSMEKSALQAELESLKRQLTEAARVKPGPLHISLLTDTTNRSETSGYSESEPSSHSASELRVTQKQLDAVRLENKYLKEQIVLSSGVKSDVKLIDTKSNVPTQVPHMATIKALQTENDRLKVDMSNLRDELLKTQEIYHTKYQTVLKEMLNDIRRREERLMEDPAQVEQAAGTGSATKYSTPGTVESGYRSQLTAPSTGKEQITPLNLSDVKESRANSVTSHTKDEQTADLLAEARKCQRLIDEEASAISERQRAPLASNSYNEVTANSTRIDDRSMSTDDHSTSEYMAVVTRRPKPIQNEPESLAQHVFQANQITPPSPSNSTHSTSTKKSASARSSRVHSRASDTQANLPTDSARPRVSPSVTPDRTRADSAAMNKSRSRRSGSRKSVGSVSRRSDDSTSSGSEDRSYSRPESCSSGSTGHQAEKHSAFSGRSSSASTQCSRHRRHSHRSPPNPHTSHPQCQSHVDTTVDSTQTLEQSTINQDNSYDQTPTRDDAVSPVSGDGTVSHVSEDCVGSEESRKTAGSITSEHDTASQVSRDDTASQISSDQGSMNRYYASSFGSEIFPSFSESVFGLLDNSNFASRAASAAERFLDDQRRRTLDLERLLDRHIRGCGEPFDPTNKTES